MQTAMIIAVCIPINKEGKNEMDISFHSYVDGDRVSVLHSASNYADACSCYDGDTSSEHAQPCLSLLRATWQQTGDPHRCGW